MNKLQLSITSLLFFSLCQIYLYPSISCVSSPPSLDANDERRESDVILVAEEPRHLSEELRAISLCQETINEEDFAQMSDILSKASSYFTSIEDARSWLQAQKCVHSVSPASDEVILTSPPMRVVAVFFVMQSKTLIRKTLLFSVSQQKCIFVRFEIN